MHYSYPLNGKKRWKKEKREGFSSIKPDKILISENDR